jgi:hypothetical protein
MKFGEKYELLESITTGAVTTFVANDKIRGQRVLVHILYFDQQTPNQITIQSVLEAFRQVAPEPAGFVLEAGKYRGTLYAYLVTKLPDDATLRAWVQQYKLQSPDAQEIIALPAEPAESRTPAAAGKPKEPQQVPMVSKPPRKIGDFTAILGSVRRPGKSSPASGAAGKDASNSTPARASRVGAPPLDPFCGAPEEFEQTEKPSKISQSDVEVVRVLFATDRKRTGRSEPKKFFWNERTENGELTLGVCEVSIPKSDRHKLGGLEKPSIYRLEFREDPNKHVALVGVQTKGEEDFFAELQERIGRSERKEAFIFIHG